MVALARSRRVQPQAEEASAFEADVLAGLSAAPKRVPAKYFYDATGSLLFERITELPEYYPTRTEIGILRDRGADILEAAGALRVTKADVTEQTSSVHLLGTCRMGNDQATSVIDKHHRSHDVKNLFICDGSSFVTSGRGQPTMTIQALAFRAGEHIARFAKRGEI